MTGFLPRLFSRLRRREPAWIEPGDLKRRSLPASAARLGVGPRRVRGRLAMPGA